SETQQQAARSAGRGLRLLREACLQLALVVATLGVVELTLRVIDLRILREGRFAGHAATFRFDPDLGWLPIAGATSRFAGSRVVTVQHNSLGLRDIEPQTGSRPTLLFLGDSFVWGYDVEAEERFTDILRRDLPGYRIVNAGVPGYGTDQAFLLLERLWGRIAPDVVVLMFCADNDRDDNSSNFRYEGYY